MISTRAAVLSLVALLAACGGGGGSSTSLSVSPAALAYRMDLGGAAPVPLVVRVTFHGDFLLVGYPVGVPEAAWITHSDLVATSDSTAEIAIGVVPQGTAGTRTTTLRFVTGKADGSAVKAVDVPVAFQVVAPFAVGGPPLAFSAVAGLAGPAAPAAGLLLAVEGSAARWTAQASAPWLTVEPASGSGPAAVRVTALGMGLPSGVHQGAVTIADAESGRQLVLDASLDVHAPRPVVEPPAGWSIHLAAGAASLTRGVVVTDEGAGLDAARAASWAVAGIDAAWLQWSPASGTTAPPAPVTLAVDPGRLGAPAAGTRTARVTLAYSNADGSGQSAVVEIPIFTCLPRAALAAPRVVPPGAAVEVVVRGEGFGCPGVAAAARLAAGGAAVPAVVDSGGQLRVSLPALDAGASPLVFSDGAGLSVPGPDLLVAAAPAMAYQAIPAPGARTRLVWDAGRSALYGVGAAGGVLERYAFADGAWSALAPVEVAGLRDAALALDGGALLVASDGALGDVDPDAAAPAFTPRVANPDAFCGGHFAQLALANDGRAVVAFRLSQCSGFASSYLYDPASRSLTVGPTLYQGTVAAPADGRRVYLASNGVSPAQPVAARDSLDGTVAGAGAAANVSAFEVSRDASRVLLGGTDVRDGALRPLGRLPISRGATIAQAGDRAFAYRDDTTATASGPRLEIYDLTAPPALPTDAFPLLATVALADSPGAGPSGPVQLAVTHDDAVVFVSGDARILVVPLP